MFRLLSTISISALWNKINNYWLVKLVSSERRYKFIELEKDNLNRKLFRSAADQLLLLLLLRHHPIESSKENSENLRKLLFTIEKSREAMKHRSWPLNKKTSLSMSGLKSNRTSLHLKYLNIPNNLNNLKESILKLIMLWLKNTAKLISRKSSCCLKLRDSKEKALRFWVIWRKLKIT